MNDLDLRALAVALGGDIVGRQVNCPGPGHSRIDRSLGVRPSASSPVGFLVHSYTGDDFASCRDYVLGKLGMPLDAWRTKGHGATGGDHEQSRQFGDSASVREYGDLVQRDRPEPDHAARIARAIAIWHQAVDARDTVVERYLASRGLSLPEGADVLRYHPRCPWRDEVANRTIYVPAMVAAMRSITTDEPHGIHRTRLTAEGVKVDRRMLGIAANAAVKIDADDAVTAGVAIGEGIETVLAARQLGFRPAWALASAGAIAAFPVLGGVEALTLLAENDPASNRAISQCAARWHAAGREVTVVTPNFGSDLNDAVRGVA